MGTIAPEYALGRQNKLPELIGTSPERACAGEQVVLPHAKKPLIAAFLHDIPAVSEIFKPVHESLVIISTEIMPVFQYKKSFDGFRYLLCRLQHGIRENILMDPVVGSFPGNIGSYGMKQEKSLPE